MKRFEFISNNIKKYEPNLPSELKSLIIELFSEFNEKFGDFPSPVKKD
ncbi:hypothetical protein KAW50_02170 [candidate division WOR-3 bacterium]|nr:hypothetical protein [candidate division WOR-3 bacterium]